MRRVSYLDGLRGFAALQVVLLHYLTAFTPAIADINPSLPHPAWENHFIHSPLFILADGYMAVAIFFLISGMVLTYSFEASAAPFATLLARRVVRLGLPMAASVLLGTLWFLLFPDAHVTVSTALGGNAWLHNTGPTSLTAGFVMREIALFGMLLGHAHFSLILPGVLGERAGLPALSQSPNPPLWTLHLEFYGSLMLLALVMAERKLGEKWGAILRWVVLLGLFAHPLGLFIIGHIAAKLLQQEKWRARLAGRMARYLAVPALVIGVALSAHCVPAWVMKGFMTISAFEKLPMRVDNFHFHEQSGAVLLFFAALALPFMQNALDSRLGRWLGRYSFSLYLVHFPILMTVTMACLTLAKGHISWPEIGLASLCGLAVTLVMTLLFERLIDHPAIILSRKVRIFQRGGRIRTTAAVRVQ